MNEETSFTAALDRFGFVVRPFKGVSMLPLLVQGRDAVRLVRPLRRLKKNDIALFQRKNGDLVLHRVVRVFEDGYIIRGDNCIKGEMVYDGQILAVAEGVYRKGKYHTCTERRIARFGLYQKLSLPFRFLRTHALAALRAVYHRVFG